MDRTSVYRLVRLVLSGVLKKSYTNFGEPQKPVCIVPVIGIFSFESFSTKSVICVVPCSELTEPVHSQDSPGSKAIKVTALNLSTKPLFNVVLPMTCPSPKVEVPSFFMIIGLTSRLDVFLYFVITGFAVTINPSKVEKLDMLKLGYRPKYCLYLSLVKFMNAPPTLLKSSLPLASQCAQN